MVIAIIIDANPEISRSAKSSAVEDDQLYLVNWPKKQHGMDFSPRGQFCGEFSERIQLFRLKFLKTTFLIPGFWSI